VQVLCKYSVQNSKIIGILKKYLKIEIKSILLLLGISLISSGIVVIQPYLMQKLIDEAFLLKDMELFFYLVATIVSIGVMGIFLSIYLQYNYTKLSIKILFALRIDIFEKIYSNHKLFFQKYKSGDLLSRLQGDITELQRFGIDSIFGLFSAVFGLIGAIIVMAYYDITLCLFALVLLPIEFYLLKPIYPKMHNTTKAVRESTAIIGSFVIESLRYVNFIKKLNQVETRKEDLTNLQEFNKKALLSQQRVQIIFTQIPVIISLLARVALILFGGYKVIKGELSIGELMAFLTYFSMVLNPVHTILGILNNLPKLKVSIDRLEAIIPPTEKEKKFLSLSTTPVISFENISFAYPNKALLLENLNLKINYGEKVVITGENGIGKSTLIDILLNFLEPLNGKVLLDHKNTQEIDSKIIQNTIGLVEQEPVIFSISLKENLLMVKKDANENELLEVLEKVGLSDFVHSLPDNINTKMSEGGANLSGGQKQRISIARAILKNAPIVLFDEPTATLDKDFVSQIDALMDECFSDSTKIIISHHDCYTNARYLKIENKKIVELENG